MFLILSTRLDEEFAEDISDLERRLTSLRISNKIANDFFWYTEKKKIERTHMLLLKLKTPPNNVSLLFEEQFVCPAGKD